ncbi:glycosyl transferase family 90-domain-containing protein [Bombardia bombarda]|uniref:Glycosyl transferase family 90-domain-containing protein n=1 Tax=Bombardia bombarda TaxID=252184 RepID=A0AA39WGL1_9PEZI|nr:glycosyl transferase family 90-domain-containing protein [Bombardia bombarda]
MGDIVARVKKARTRQSRQIRQTTLVLGVCLVVYCLFFVWITPTAHGNDHYTDNDVVSSSPNPSRPEYFLRYTSSDTTLNNLSLTEEQCNAVFPGLTKDIDDVVAQGPFIVKQMGDFGPLQGRIKDGKIYIIHAQRKADLSKEMVNSRTAALHQLHRALLTAPAPLPDTIFSLNFQDQPFGTAFTYSRAADPALRSKAPDARSFLMPHFSFWAWNLPFVGSMWRAADAIAALESANYNTPEKWQSGKIAKAVWRGTAWFNSVNSPQLRQKLLATARGKPWADVQALDWATGGGGSNKNASNALKIEDFCRYKYVVHTEGITYSGRFQFLQMCASVVLTPPIQWMQHTTHLIKPLFSSSLDLTSKPNRPWTPSERVRKAWPVQYAPSQANIVFVAPDWSDLEDTVAWLEAHPQVAEGIARRQRELFVGGGYFSPAAETCYWRALLCGWASMARPEGGDWVDGKDGELGVPFETFSLSNGD